MSSNNRKLWISLFIVFVISFAVLGWTGFEIYFKMPPIPEKVVTKDGVTIYTKEQITNGQEVWRSAGGQQLGSVWGHGSYVAPDWSADWLHREIVALRDILANRDFKKPFDQLTTIEQAQLDVLVKEEIRKNTYDSNTGVVTVSRERFEAIHQTAKHFSELFANDPSLDKLRENYAMSSNLVKDGADRDSLTAFFFWSSWSASTDRPGETDLSYTSNWPHEPIIDNKPTTETGIWSIASVILMIAAIAAMIFFHAAKREESDPAPLKVDPMFSMAPTPSMKATKKYFFVVVALFLVQILTGVITAHYAVEGRSFFGFPLADILPYSVSRTIHTQFAVLWIATAWLATGLYIAPIISGREPKFQKLGVDLLFYALLFVVAGSTAFGWYGSLNHQSNSFAFWIGNQGLEFTSMGRIWQILLFIGLLFWVTLLSRGLLPALKKGTEGRGLIAMVLLSAICIGGFYATSLTWGQHTHYSIVEYWRWWLVHLWVEGFFEVFATAVIALLFVRLGLISSRSANTAIILETIIFLFGGILGTMHHLYFTGTPTFVIAIGGMFSALEVVPLAMVGIEAYHNYKRSQSAPWVKAYQVAIFSFISVSFWNIVGAGLLGFSINTPIALYYMQGLNMTPAHGHAALFGVYGMLGIGLTLFSMRGLSTESQWSNKMLKASFWLLNIGLAMMVFMSLVPAGIYQSMQSISKGFWFARSSEVIHSHIMENLVWLRVPGDVVFGIGGLLFGLFILKLFFGAKKR